MGRKIKESATPRMQRLGGSEMMRRKLGILFLAGVTVLAGTQEAMRQFDGLRSSLNDLTRASLWSGLIVYAQPVSDGKLPAPQIYYLTPQQTSPASPQDAVLADNNNNSNASPAKPETKNNHVAEELAAATSAERMLPSLLPSLEIEDAAKSELVLDKVAAPVVLAAAHPLPAPKLDKVRVYEEVARNVAGARRFKQQGDVIARAFVKEFDAAKLDAEIARLTAVQEQLETPKLKSFSDAENAERRLALRVLRRAPRPERHERMKVVAPFAVRRVGELPESSSIGCEKTMSAAQSVAAVEAIVAVAGVATNVKIASEALATVEVESPPAAAPAAFVMAPTTGTTWALGCDTEPEYSK
jgi:hypothetical protein